MVGTVHPTSELSESPNMEFYEGIQTFINYTKVALRDASKTGFGPVVCPPMIPQPSL
jgi:hypothetical protein